MDADLDTLATALYVKVDDLLKDSPEQAPWRPVVDLKPQVSDAELATLSVLQALLRFTSETGWLRHARRHLGHLFPYLPFSRCTPSTWNDASAEMLDDDTGFRCATSRDELGAEAP